MPKYARADHWKVVNEFGGIETVNNLTTSKGQQEANGLLVSQPFALACAKAESHQTRPQYRGLKIVISQLVAKIQVPDKKHWSSTTDAKPSSGIFQAC